VTLLRSVRIAAGALALLVAVAVALVAEDARRWPARIDAGDVRFAASTQSGDAWSPSDRLPVRLGDDLLGIEDDVAYRRALQLVRRLRSASASRGTVWVQLLGRAQAALVGLEQRQDDAQGRSATANLLGIVYTESGAASGAAGADFRRAALTSWERAVRLDPQNVDAKFNLELMLSLVRREESLSAGVPFGRGRAKVGGSEAGTRPNGEGY
jgi:hypothetical protein